MEYSEFLKKKQKAHIESGFDCEPSNEFLFPFQRFIVKRALKAGKYAVFANTGLGKTLIQLSWASEVTKYTNKPVLILAYLAVSGQTIKEAKKFNLTCQQYNNQKVIGQGVYITNYDQLKNIDTSLFSGIVLDESSILKNFEGKTKKLIIDSFKNTSYKLACTATPSPNDPMEIGNHSEFLDVMSRNEMLSMYFVHDGGNTSKWRVKGHAVENFYKWIASWGVMLSKPSDLGFYTKGYDLPPLNYIEHEVKAPKKQNGLLFNDTAVSATDFNKELRNTINERLELTAKIVNSTNENFIVWIAQDAEGVILRKLIPDAVEVRGSDKKEKKEANLLEFAENKFRVLITKPKIAQFGLNYQNCHNQIFPSLDFSFESLYQSIRRSYRFGQESEVNIHIIKVDTMGNVIKSIKRKEEQFLTMQTKMSNSMSKYLRVGNIKDINLQPDVKTEFYHIMHGDCVQRIDDLEDESLGFSVFSPPFAELYTYSDSLEDMGNSKDYKEFLTQFGFLVSKLYKKLQPGRNVAVHCMDLPIQKGKEGFIGLRDFSGMILKAFNDAGFIYHSRVTIWKNPVTEMQRTKALGLLHKQVKKDSTMSRVGIPDYVMIFRKDGERNNPVTNTELPVDLWQKYASPVWMDIDYSDTLNFREGREEKDEKHICPLQLPTIERLIHLYTNKGDSVFTPFLGIGSEVFKAVEMGRYGIGTELKSSYFDLAKKHVKSAVFKKNQSTLF